MILTDDEILIAMQTAHPEGEEYPMWNELVGRLLTEVRAVARTQLKKVVEGLKDALENDFVMTYSDEDNPSEPTISPQRINEIIQALLKEVA